jgi:ribonuclease D
VGFDSEFRATTHKYEDDGVSLIQISAQKKIFVFDAIKLSTSKNFYSFLEELFYSLKTIKIGHTIKSDYLEMSKTFNLDRDKFSSFVDIA